MSRSLRFPVISAGVAALVVWVGSGANSTATRKPNLSQSLDATYGFAAPAPSSLGRSQTTIASLAETDAQISVFGFGFFPPSGQLSFTDATSGNPAAPNLALNTANAMPSLLPQVSTGTGANSVPAWTELADLNGDGILDLVTSLSGTDSLRIQLGKGDGTFETATIILIASGFSPGEVHAVSLRGNRTLDLIVVSSKTNQFAVLLGHSDGTFQMPVFYTTGTSANVPSSLTGGDFNLDGNVDIAVANSVDKTVSIFLGNGAGALTLFGLPINVGHDPEAIRAGDFNGDGFSDLAVANYLDGTVSILLNMLNGTFAPTTIGDGASSGLRALAITGSGSSMLLAVANFNANSISLLANNGSGIFSLQKPVPVGSGPRDVRWTDINGDGIPDLVVANYTGGTLSVLLGSPGGSYIVLGPFSTGGNPASVAVGDLDRDGTPDIAISNPSTNETGVFLSGMEISVPYTGLSLTSGHAFSATYTPDGGSKYGSSTSPLVTLGTGPAATTTKLFTSGSPSMLNGAVTFSAAVTPSVGSIPDGDAVAFYNGATQIGTGTTAGAVALFTTTSLTAGTHTIRATYRGDANFNMSTGTVTQIVNLDSTTTTLSTSGSPSSFGNPVTLTAHVTTTGSTPPSGTVTFKNGTVGLGTASVNASGMATLTKSTLPVGSDTLTASYGGDAANGKSTSSPMTQMVNPAQISMSLSSSPNPSIVGKAVKFTAKLTSMGTLPTGVVTFASNSATLGSATISASNGSAIFTTTKLSAGTDVVTASYAGSTNYTATSAMVMQKVSSTTTMLTTSGSPSSFGKPVILTAHVTTTGSTTPTGTVTFKNGTVGLGTASVNTSGVATLTKTTLPLGTNLVTASYGGDAMNGASASSPVMQVVNQAQINMSLSASPNPSAKGKSVKFTATLTSTGGMPTGMVTFTYNGTKLGTGTISVATGDAVFTTSALPVGANVVTATFAGSADYSAASAMVTQKVQ